TLPFLFQSKGFLIKWKGCSKWECTVEPNKNLNNACLQELTHPRKSLDRRLEAASEAFVYAVQNQLFNSRQSSGLIKVNIDLDICRWVFQGKGKQLEKGWLLCDEHNFGKLGLPFGWYTQETKLGNVVSLEFPVRVKGTVTRRKVSKRFPDGFPIETLQVFIVTRMVAADL
ncbi:uncharacterized protein LOC144168275, partial [Haemaphysalis longicornis]